MNNICLRIFFDASPEVQLVSNVLANAFIDRKGERYVRVTSSPGSIGHYDWLRNRPNIVIGVRYWPFDDIEYINAVQAFFLKVRGLDYISVDPDFKNITVLFDPLAVFDEDLSNDQDLGDAGIYVTDAGHYAMCFEFDLKGAEIEGGA
jgi:hypothetical protein